MCSDNLNVYNSYFLLCFFLYLCSENFMSYVSWLFRNHLLSACDGPGVHEPWEDGTTKRGAVKVKYRPVGMWSRGMVGLCVELGKVPCDSVV